MRMRGFGAIAAAILAVGFSACSGGDEGATPAESAAAPRAARSSAGNHAPEIRSVRLDPEAPIDGDRVNAMVSVQDQDGDPVELEFVWRISGRVVQRGDASIDLQRVTKRDRIEVEVTASDGKLESEPARAEVSVPNRRPTVIGIAVHPEPEVLPGETVVATAQASDPDSDPLEYFYRWQVNGELRDETGDSFATEGLQRGDEIQAIVVASDGSIESDERTSIVLRVGNSHPEIVSNPQGNWTDEGFSYEIQASDPDHDVPLRYALRSGPRGMRVDSVLGKVFWQPSADQAGVHPIEIAVSDSLGATSVQMFEITVTAESGASGPPPASAQR
jgi:hypothetical protein